MRLNSFNQLDKLVRQFATLVEDPSRTDWGHPIESDDDYAAWQVSTGPMVWTLEREMQSPIKAVYKLRPNTFDVRYDYLVIEAEFGSDGSVKELTIAVVVPALVVRSSTSRKVINRPVPDQVHYIQADFDADQVVTETHEGTEIWTDAIGDGSGRVCDLNELKISIIPLVNNKTQDWMFAPVPQDELVAVAG